MRRYSSFSLIVLLLGLVKWSCQLATLASHNYTAVVLEFAPVLDYSLKPTSRLRLAMQELSAIIESPDTNDIDILVLPEHVLNTYDVATFVPAAEERIVPCIMPNYEFFLVELSCIARSRRFYLVANLLEKVPCVVGEANCVGHHIYNTNVAFDREGRLISRYRKSHLYKYEWYSVDILKQPELATFTTDFGVTFGHFICFDMLFYAPAMQLLKELNVRDVVYPTYWFSELPFLTAVQLQEGWAYANDVNLLAANAAIPKEQQTGSGIFAGKLGRLAALTQQESKSVLLKAVVPKYEFRQASNLLPLVPPAFIPQLETPRLTNVSLLRDYNVDVFNTTLLEINFQQVLEQRQCHNEFCCTFSVARSLVTESAAHVAYRYRLAAYSGTNVTFQQADSADLSICALIACTSEELHSCGHIFPAALQVGNKYYFSALNVSGEFKQAGKRLIIPSTVDGSLMPLPVGQYAFAAAESTNATRVTMELTAPKLDLLTFGIWANYYSAVRNTHNLNAALLLPGNAAPPLHQPCIWVALVTFCLALSGFFKFATVG